MLASEQNELKSQVTAACLEAFPEAKAIVIWGGAVAADFHPQSSDVDVIIEIDQDISKEFLLSERLRAFVQKTSFCRLDPFLYLSETKADEPLEFIAPFGFYKANPFIPHLLKTQNEVTFGTSRLLERLPLVSLSEALIAYHPQVMSALRRLRMDAEIEKEVTPILGKHRASLFVILRTLYAFDQGRVASKKAALEHLVRKYPRFENLAAALGQYLQKGGEKDTESLTPELLLAFSHDMAEALQAAKRRETTH